MYRGSKFFAKLSWIGKLFIPSQLYLFIHYRDRESLKKGFRIEQTEDHEIYYYILFQIIHNYKKCHRVW